MHSVISVHCREGIKKNKIFVVFPIFLVLNFFPFPPYLYSRANGSRRSLLCYTFLKSERSDLRIAPVHKRAIVSYSLPSLLKKEQKRDSLFFSSESLFLSFAHENLVICPKNQRGNSQPWCLLCLR